MKRTFPLLVYAVLAALLVAQSASAAVVVTKTGLQGASGKYAPLTASVANTTGNYQPSLLATRNNTAGTDTAKSWLQFDLANTWATYDKAKLLSATLSLTTQNGTTRSFEVSGILDGALLDDESSAESWSKTTLTFNNAPFNDAGSGWALDWTGIYGGAPLWQARSGGVLLGTDPAYVNNAQYTSGDLSAFLATDSDGLVTFITHGPDGINSNTRFWSVGGAWQTTPGQIEPFLTLTFIPEPATLAILGLGGLFLRRRLA